jgi:hypothetical protein
VCVGSVGTSSAAELGRGVDGGGSELTSSCAPVYAVKGSDEGALHRGTQALRQPGSDNLRPI